MRIVLDLDGVICELKKPNETYLEVKPNEDVVSKMKEWKKEGHYLIISRICTAYYFTHFLIILPILGMFEKTLPVPLNIFKNPKAKNN